jgi:hypothetical protein
MPLAYAFAILSGAALLFLLEPMIAKMVLPVLGGSPSVWNTCMVFFQAGLLLGYLYAHGSTRRLGPRTQVLLHAVLLAAPALVLPVGLRASAVPVPPASSSPVLWLLLVLTGSIGVPFAVVAATGPLLQRWFASTAHARAGDPYFLYAASNAGSLGGLLAYPLLVEPFLPLSGSEGGAPPSQGVAWSAAYGLYALGTATCGLLMLRALPGHAASPLAPVMGPTAAESLGARRRALWLLCAFVPSSATLGVTQHLTTDVAAVPLLWVVPLGVYLVTFILTFSSSGTARPGAWSVALSLLVVAVSATYWPVQRLGLAAGLLLHLAALLAVGMVCHGRLAADRPSPERLTEFYLWVGLGGVLGGAFNALVAPLLFTGIAEYPIALVLALLLRPRWADERPAPPGAGWVERGLDVLVPALLALFALWFQVVPDASSTRPQGLLPVVQTGVPSLLALSLMGWRERFALAAAALFAVGTLRSGAGVETLHAERTFFGVHRVRLVRHVVEAPPPASSPGESRDVYVPSNVLIHGSTIHGQQIRDPQFRGTPTAYYHRSGPIGQVFQTLGPLGRLRRVALVGLGAGTLAAYGEPGQEFTVYEIDPAVIRIARDRGLFTFVADSRATFRWVAGDGRLSLEAAAGARYDLIVLDAFSSDAIPVHLLTREAFQLYFDRLAPQGLLAVHLTNEYLDPVPVVEAVAKNLGLATLLQHDRAATVQERIEGKAVSVWAVLGRTPEALGPLVNDSRWRWLARGAASPADPRYLWTDSYSNLIRLLRFG